MDPPPTSVANKRLTIWLSPLDATLTKNRGAPPLRRSGVYPPIPIPELIPFSQSPPKPAHISALSSALLPALPPRKRARKDRAHPRRRQNSRPDLRRAKRRSPPPYFRGRAPRPRRRSRR